MTMRLALEALRRITQKIEFPGDTIFGIGHFKPGRGEIDCIFGKNREGESELDDRSNDPAL